MGERLTWTEETMQAINKLTPHIKEKAFDPDWFLLRQHFEQFEERLQNSDAAKNEALSLLASSTDLLNSWAREMGVLEARNEAGIKGVINRLWSELSTRLFKGNYIANSLGGNQCRNQRSS